MKNKMQIKSVHSRRILNSHGQFTNEFIIFLNNGSVGRGASPKGETISIYEDKHFDTSPKAIIELFEKDGIFKNPVTQEDLDKYLEDNIPFLGRNNCYALSLAFYDASEQWSLNNTVEIRNIENRIIPKLCVNILNGGNHAYTNPVQSEFSEFLLVAKTNDITSVLGEHMVIQEKVKDILSLKDKVYVNKNLVHKSEHGDNRDWLDLIMKALKELGLENHYDLMIDASAGDLWNGKRYLFNITDKRSLSSEGMCDYWSSLIKDYNLRILEDPFQETDYDSWQLLTSNQAKCNIIGDNLYSGNPERIAEGISKRYTHGIILKPDQAGTVSNTIKAINLVQAHNHLLIVSHRSISTESTFLAHIANKYNAEYIKNGPIFTDYSSIIRLNEFIRLTGLGYE